MAFVVVINEDQGRGAVFTIYFCTVIYIYAHIHTHVLVYKTYMTLLHFVSFTLLLHKLMLIF